VKISGAVSPHARQVQHDARHDAVNCRWDDNRGDGSRFRRPSATAASRKESGTALKNSSVLRTAIGIIITPNAMPPANVEK